MGEVVESSFRYRKSEEIAEIAEAIVFAGILKVNDA